MYKNTETLRLHIDFFPSVLMLVKPVEKKVARLNDYKRDLIKYSLSFSQICFCSKYENYPEARIDLESTRYTRLKD